MEHATQARYLLPILSFNDGEHELVTAFARAAKLFRVRRAEPSEVAHRGSIEAAKRR
jgi:hypothetical protein